MSTMNLDVTTIRPRRVLVWSKVKECLAAWRHRARSRQELMHLSTMDLRDIGISRCEAEFEASKPFWHA